MIPTITIIQYIGVMIIGAGSAIIGYPIRKDGEWIILNVIILVISLFIWIGLCYGIDSYFRRKKLRKFIQEIKDKCGDDIKIQ